MTPASSGPDGFANVVVARLAALGSGVGAAVLGSGVAAIAGAASVACC